MSRIFASTWFTGHNLRGLLAAGLLIVLAACGPAATPTPTPAPTEAEPLVLGVAVSNLGVTFFQSFAEGAQSAADRLDVTLILEDAGDESAPQLEQLQSLIDQGVDALLINPVDTEAVVPLIEAANEAGIPVFTFDRSAAGGEIVSHIASDNLAGGQMAGDYLAETLNQQGSVVEILGQSGTSAAEQRGAGFNEALSAYDEMEIVAQIRADWSREQAQEEFAAVLEEQTDIAGVFAHNDEMILGAIAAAQAAGRADDIQFIGFDAVEDAIAAIEAGDLLATVAQQPAEMGRISVETAVAHLNGESVEAEIPVDLALITR